MKLSVKGLLKLKPFEEDRDRLASDEIYGNSLLLTIGIVSSAGLGLTALALTPFQSDLALKVLALSTALSAVVAGCEWNAGLKARALNQLFASILCILALVALTS